MIKLLLTWFKGKNKTTEHPWHLYCKENPHSLGCRVYDI
jgi:hypothetical protein